MQCEICGNDDNKLFKIREMMFGICEEFEYLECSYCGCLFIINPPNDLTNYYDNYYSLKTENLNPIKKYAQKKRDEYLLFKKGILGKLINKKFPNPELNTLKMVEIQKNTKILDVGCGNGILLHSLNKLKFNNLTGIDPYLHKEFHGNGLNILKKTIFELPDERNYDLIMFHHSFEHMDHQLEVLDKVSDILSENGICMIRMPVKTEYIWDKYGVNWVQIDAPRHTRIHTLKSFNTLIEKTQFKIKNIVFDSTDFQFWASEQYKKDIAYYSTNSYRINPRKSIFTKNDIKNFKKRSQALNEKQLGDQAVFILE